MNQAADKEQSAPDVSAGGVGGAVSMAHTPTDAQLAPLLGPRLGVGSVPSGVMSLSGTGSAGITYQGEPHWVLPGFWWMVLHCSYNSCGTLAGLRVLVSGTTRTPDPPAGRGGQKVRSGIGTVQMFRTITFLTGSEDWRPGRVLGGAHRPVFSHLSLLLLSGETQEPGHLLLPRCHQEQQRQRPAESHESRLRVLLVDGWTGGGTGGASTEQSVSAERLHGGCLLSVALLVCLAASGRPPSSR